MRISGLFAPLLLASIVAFSSMAASPDDALLLHYNFDQPAGSVANDRSGNGNDGRILGAVRDPFGGGHALRFDSPLDRVACDDKPSLIATDAFTVAFWLRPDAVPAGEVTLISKQKAWTVTLYQFGDMHCYLAGEGGKSSARSVVLAPMGVWHHFAATFDGKRITLYVNGRACPQSHPCATTKIAPGGDLVIGRVPPAPDDQFEGLVGASYHGLLDDVRVYGRTLSADEVRALSESTMLPAIQVKPYVYSFAGGLVAQIFSADLSETERRSARLHVRITRRGDRKTLRRATTRFSEPRTPAEVRFVLNDLAPGTYQIDVQARTAMRRRIGPPATVTFVWPDRATWPGAKSANVLNALVTELLNVEDPAPEQKEFVFTNPRDGWIFVRTRAAVPRGGRVQLSLGPVAGGIPLLINQQKSGPAEAMRLLPAGGYRLRTRTTRNATLKGLVVRAIPELVFAKVPGVPHVREYGVYDWEFLARDVLPNINVAVTGDRPGPRRAWQGQGRKCIHTCRPVGLGNLASMTPQQGADHYATLPGLSDPYYDGLIADEFGYPGDRRTVQTVKTLQIMQKDWPEKYAGRRYDAYTGGGAMHYGPTAIARDFLKAVTACGGHIVHERYLHTYPNQAAARAFIDTRLTSLMIASRRAYPGAERTMTICLGYFSAPPETLGLYPDVNYRTYLDMQFRTLATQPDFFGLHGVMTYLSTYADEEVVRWAGRLMRHYAIEGNTEPLTADSYNLRHLANGDFADGTSEWALSPAEPGSIRRGRLDGFGALRGNWVGGTTWQMKQGDTFLVMKRSATKPNAVSQIVTSLTPGRLYSLRFFTADYADLKNTVTAKKKLAASTRLEDVELVPDKSFVHLSQTIHTGVGFSGRGKPAYLNFHRIVFRARTKRSRLTLSDWETAETPGGPLGQEVLFNFVQIQPYLE